MKERRPPQPVVARCKLVLVGDVQCGKTAMLQVLAKDCYPEVSCPPAGQRFSLPACLPRGQAPSHLPGGASRPPLTPPQPAPSSGARPEDRAALPSPETCSTSAAALAGPSSPLHPQAPIRCLPTSLRPRVGSLGRGNWRHFRVWGFSLT